MQVFIQSWKGLIFWYIYNAWLISLVLELRIGNIWWAGTCVPAHQYKETTQL